MVPLRDTPRKGDAKREAAATDAWLAESGRSDSAMGAKPSQALKELQDAERDSVLRFGPENPRAALEASVLRLPRAFADFAAARRELHAFRRWRARPARRRRRGGAYTGRRVNRRAARRRAGTLFLASMSPPGPTCGRTIMIARSTSSSRVASMARVA